MPCSDTWFIQLPEYSSPAPVPLCCKLLNLPCQQKQQSVQHHMRTTSNKNNNATGGINPSVAQMNHSADHT